MPRKLSVNGKQSEGGNPKEEAAISCQSSDSTQLNLAGTLKVIDVRIIGYSFDPVPVIGGEGPIGWDSGR